ncbi:MAG: peroxiredoxin [Thermoplasmata archaeon]
MLKENDNVVFVNTYLPEKASGKWVVLYFYPADFTPGCTREAQEFRDLKPQFDAENVEIVGVSVKSEEIQSRFKEKYNLNFSLISDKDKVLIEKFGVNSMGRAKRTTFILDADRKIRKAWEKVSVNGHAEEVLKFIKEVKK